MVKEAEIPFLVQLIETLEDLQYKLEEAYEKQDYETFTKVKTLSLKIQKKISELLK